MQVKMDLESMIEKEASDNEESPDSTENARKRVKVSMSSSLVPTSSGNPCGDLQTEAIATSIKTEKKVLFWSVEDFGQAARHKDFLNMHSHDLVMGSSIRVPSRWMFRLDVDLKSSEADKNIKEDWIILRYQLTGAPPGHMFMNYHLRLETKDPAKSRNILIESPRPMSYQRVGEMFGFWLFPRSSDVTGSTGSFNMRLELTVFCVHSTQLDTTAIAERFIVNRDDEMNENEKNGEKDRRSESVKDN